MTMTQAPMIEHRQAAALTATENERFVDLVRSLGPDDWSKPTDCPAWDVRAMVGHVLGMMEFTCSVREFVHVVRAGGTAAGERPAIDCMTEVQVADRAHLTHRQLLDRLAAAAPRTSRIRRRMPAPLRQVTMPQEIEGVTENWRLGYLFDVILTRDTWMHRADISRATGREMVLTPDHDGLLVADVVAEWARRHGRPYVLTLYGPAGGHFRGGGGGEEITLDAVEFCRILSGRGTGAGLLGQPVPF
ncbi:maleylpyruvate isomerase family mycothiol-dependent enzyme [Planomonospora sp. ID67723]|uniref:maleylpyruvate isomerase family mycothiol-dependent enzyme n=1 Tax=Planomonospora sp. ID67723 TaxID=2738134 RepID=UPI0018C3A45B|nr:maleylpyruvate isomerase family mycothiol-dependent enzyme [Planomonospora sp. ID67723]MBG0827183.1 maleylpyruvate isomerase family mycothiol-dependent enzyme [Planomonospora sp. ID67723]